MKSNLKSISIWHSLISAAAILFPLLPLLALHGSFAGDWPYHLWPIGFMGEYLKIHHEFPFLVNSREMIFLPAHIFYGQLFYPLLATLSSWAGPDVVIRFAVVALFCLQFFLVRAVVLKMTENPLFSTGIACLINWAVYPLTNLYNRAALTELFATMLLTCSFCCFLQMVLMEVSKHDSRVRLSYGFVGAWCGALAFGCHPITALFGSLFLAAAAIGILPFLLKQPSRVRWQVAGMVIYGALLTLGLNLPWLYLNHLFLNKIYISTGNLGLFYYGSDIDSWRARFSILPTDLRVVGGVMGEAPNPYLDAQINMPLVFLVAAGLVMALWRFRSRLFSKHAEALPLLVLGLALFVLTTWMSLSPESYDHLPRFATIIQFIYRMISYQNFSLLLMLVALLRIFGKSAEKLRGDQAATSGAFSETRFVIFMMSTLIISAIGVTIKNSEYSPRGRFGFLGPKHWRFFENA